MLYVCASTGELTSMCDGYQVYVCASTGELTLMCDGTYQDTDLIALCRFKLPVLIITSCDDNNQQLLADYVDL